jgi:hypothetical protein
VSANTRLDSLADLERRSANLLVRCACGHSHVLSASRLNRYALLRGWNTQLEVLGGHLRCNVCHRRGPQLKATPDPPTPADPFPRTEDGWKRLYRRLRG